MLTVENQCQKAKQAYVETGILSTELKNDTLKKMADALEAQSSFIIEENAKDLENGRQTQLSTALMDRLTLTKERIFAIAQSIREISELDDPIGELLDEWTLPNGLEIQKKRVPFGVIGMIYEARPNVTADAVALTFKTGNAVVLRGSSSAYHSNSSITETLRSALIENNISGDFIQLLEDTSRESVTQFLQMKNHLDLVIPRGSANLIQRVVEQATVPTIETGAGICHVYVDAEINLDQAMDIVFNSKTQRPSVCNACETLLVHETVAHQLLPELIKRLKEAGVSIRGDEKVVNIVSCEPATEEDWSTEYNDLILSVKVVSSLNEALSHIHTYGTLHTEVIVSENSSTIEQFLNSVDASTVIANASSRFTDGGEFGFGAEIGISTQKLHARGPMGLPEMTSYKYTVRGNGQLRGV